MLGYINNESRWFHTYVANRIHKIRRTTNPTQWHYVPTTNNPADNASRGLTVEQLKASNWLTGPEFLWESVLKPGTFSPDSLDNTSNDPEVKRSLVTMQMTPKWLSTVVQRYSSWNKAVGVTACLLKVGRIAKKSSIDDIGQREEAAHLLIQLCQQEHFSGEVQQLKDQKADKRSRI